MFKPTVLVFALGVVTFVRPAADAFSSRTTSRSCRRAAETQLYHSATTTPTIGKRIDINENFQGLHRIHANPDVFVIDNFLDETACCDLVERAKAKKLERSPVAYAGWTEDLKTLLELAAKGPVVWLALLGAWVQVKDNPSSNQIDLVIHALQNYAVLFPVAAALIFAFTKSRADGLKELRTSTSTTIDDLSTGNGAREFVQKAAQLFGGGNKVARLFEAPTVIRYEPGQVLAPHFDANRSAEIEDANRGGQTLATLIVYLNDVEKGGLTRFGKLPSDAETHLTIQPKLGDALLFFPADASGQFDERTEHEGCPAVDEKWIARIWRHTSRVPPPFGLTEEALAKIE